MFDLILQKIEKEASYTKHYHFNNMNKYTVWCNDRVFLEDLNDYLSYHLESFHESDIQGELFHNSNIFIIIDDKIFCKFHEIFINEYFDYYAYIEKSGTIVIKRDSDNHFIFLANRHLKNLNLIKDIYCIIRRKNLLTLQQNGVLLLHGASFQINNEATIILGDKGFGKSFISDYSIYCLGANYIAADQTLVFSKDNKPICAGNITSYRMNVEQNFIYKGIEIENYINKYKYEEQRNIGKKLNIPPMFFHNVLNKEIVSQSILKNIVFIQEGMSGYENISAQVANEHINKYFLEDEISNLNDNGNKILDIIYQNCRFYTIEKYASMDIIKNFIKKIEGV